MQGLRDPSFFPMKKPAPAGDEEGRIMPAARDSLSGLESENRLLGVVKYQSSDQSRSRMADVEVNMLHETYGRPP